MANIPVHLAFSVLHVRLGLLKLLSINSQFTLKLLSALPLWRRLGCRLGLVRRRRCRRRRRRLCRAEEGLQRAHLAARARRQPQIRQSQPHQPVTHAAHRCARRRARGALVGSQLLIQPLQRDGLEPNLGAVAVPACTRSPRRSSSEISSGHPGSRQRVIIW